MPMDKSVSIPTTIEMRESDEDFDLKNQLAVRTMPDTDEEKSKALVPLVESPALNRLLLRNARKSLNEIAMLTGMDVEEVSERLSGLLDNRSWRDDIMEEKLILADIAMLFEDVRERMGRRSLEDEAFASMARVQLATSKTLLEQIADRRKMLDGKLNAIDQQAAEYMAAAIRLAQERAVFEIEKEYPNVDPVVIRRKFEDALPEAIEFLEAKANA